MRQALREWTRLSATAVGVAFLVGAGQLGVLYGLDIVRWDRTFGAGGENGWSALLTWVAWVVMTATVAGAGAAARLGRRLRRVATWPARAAVSIVAGLGGGASAFLAVLPATAARPPTNVDPDLVVMITAGFAVPVGIVVAVAALTWTPVAGNVITTTTWVWVFAAGSIIWPLVTNESWPLARLAVPEPLTRPGDPVLMFSLGLVVLVSAILAMIARFGGAGKVAVAVSGLGGPLLIAGAYVIAGPGVSGDHSDQLVPYQSALLFVLAGGVASVLVAVAGRRPPKPRRPPSRTPVPTAETDYVGWVSGLGPGQPGAAVPVPHQGARPAAEAAAYPGGLPDEPPTVPIPPATDPEPTEARPTRAGRRSRAKATNPKVTEAEASTVAVPTEPPLLGMPPGDTQPLAPTPAAAPAKKGRATAAPAAPATVEPPRNPPPPAPKRSRHAKPEPPPRTALPSLPPTANSDPDEPTTNILLPGHP
ncbi:hypothetical protein GCM10009681_17200 [Luedemannella helvata]|uniref:Uncharacterized protein n=2 Tax=Luedemannella helvata TaxID=349315 RepID=A0ABN2K1V7_9ACTN